MCPSDDGAVYVWPKERKNSQKKFLFFKDKKETLKQYEYFSPFKEINKSKAII